jgi:hypothetical protein
MEGRGGGEAQGVADPKKCKVSATFYLTDEFKGKTHEYAFYLKPILTFFSVLAQTRNLSHIRKMIKGWQKFGTMNPSFPRPSLS